MDYNYESLLDERFQMLCQALIIRDYPDLQCLPVGMPDGGRDAISSGSGKDLIIFQVKFSRDPRKVTDPYTWLRKVISDELPKIELLRDRGATRYILVTNVIGTSHLDSGGVDKVQAYLDTLPLPSQCWWRSEIDRRLDTNYDLKLHYPTLMSGPDMVRLMWETACAGEGKDRRHNALRAYFHHQSSQDSTIRFKQAELLPTPLFDLFIDVPIDLHFTRQRAFRLSRRAIEDFAPSVIAARARKSEPDPPRYVTLSGMGDESEQLWVADANGLLRQFSVGAAELLLNPDFGGHTLGTVLEGAPGQGKSTLAQFLAQVNRVRILDDRKKIAKIPDLYVGSPLCLPFKLELRDVAVWIKGIDPWSTVQGSSHNRPASLEGAIAGHIERYSGGISFDVADLHMALANSPVMLILDALDEVADLDDRKRVIEEVQIAVGRLQTSCRELRLIITSRPTAIAGAPDFPRSQFLNLTLGSIDRRLALDYTARWAKARRLDHKDTAEIRNILDAKMNSAHMAELAKNTMQLSILLSLIHLRGSSLPDKRTELYDTYIDVLLNREAEKSRIVRENRELLIDIHRFLGYYIHAHAEAKGSTGRIPYHELKDVVSTYLVREGRPASLLEDLLVGIVDRFGALVSRIEGTWEFEVQPLREYFAARHLYDTAPYSPAGRVSPGTKPDRFDGIAGNAYWLNVTRFFAGCFSKGELLDLADRLVIQVESESQKFSTYPKMLAIYLLQDWVFTQSPKATAQVVNDVFDGFGLRWASAAYSTANGNYGDTIIPQFELSAGAGAEELVDRIWSSLNHVKNSEFGTELCHLAVNQDGGHYVRQIWTNAVRARKATGLSRQFLLVSGWHLGALEMLSAELLSELIGDNDEDGLDGRLALALLGGAPVESLPATLLDQAIEGVVDRPSQPLVRPSAPLTAFAYMIAPETWIRLTNQNYHYNSLITSLRWNSEDSGIAPVIGGSDASPIVSAVNATNTFLYQLLVIDKQQGLPAWRGVTDCLHNNFDSSWSELELGVMSGAVGLEGDSGQAHPDLFDANVSIIDRIRGARRRAGHMSWWRTQRLKATSDADHCFWILAAYAWASPRVLGRLLDEVVSSIRGLPSIWRSELYEACMRSASYSPHSKKPLLPEDSIRVRDCKVRFCIDLLFDRLTPTDQRALVDGVLARKLTSPSVATMVLRHVIDEILAGRRDLVSNMQLIRKCSRAGGRSYGRMTRAADGRLNSLGDKWIEVVLDNATEFPTDLVVCALRLRNRVVIRSEPVEAIAERERWFADE